MAALLPNPEPQFCDADGNPYAGGTIATFVPGTTTAKATWLDPLQAALNTNPIVLDAAGRCVMYGDGDYRLILRDASGNQIWDQPSSTIVSAAMQPVISAPTIADAVHLLGLDDTVTAEALASAISTEQAARIAADNAEIAARTNADANLQSQITALAARVTALEGAGGTTAPAIEHGEDHVDTSGHTRITFSSPYTDTPAVVAQCIANSYDVNIASILVDLSGFDIWIAYGIPSVVPVSIPISFHWHAMGPR